MSDVIKEKVSKLLAFNNPFKREQKTDVQEKVSQMYGNAKVSNNPFLDKSGNLVNPYIDYQTILDNPNVMSAAKKYISEATGLTPSINENNAQAAAAASAADSSAQQKSQFVAMVQPTQLSSTTQTTTSAYANRVGQRITDTSKYKNSAAKGQCVWYVRGRAAEKLGVEPGSLGHAKDVWYNAPSDKKVAATADNLKANMIVSYGSGPGTAAQYGHVIFIEDVVGDTVYYTEGGSTYYNKGTDGVVKTASRQGILNGVNNNGATIGTNIVGFIDMNKY